MGGTAIQFCCIYNMLPVYNIYPQMKRSQAQKKSTYLDLAEFMMTGPFSPKPSPAFRPHQPEGVENLTPLSRPLYIEIEQGERSPFFKQLLSKVGTSEIEFLDFTLGGNGEEELEDFQQDLQQQVEQGKQEEMSVIAEEQEEASNGEREQRSKKKLVTSHFEYLPEEYISNMHLLDLDPALLNQQHFSRTLTLYHAASLQEKREFITLYLTDQDLEIHSDATLQTLTQIALHNLRQIGNISRLQRKGKVSRYLQKKKRRIWRKKINYDCRKKVADSRLRVKGKFVTSEQACTMLGMQQCSQEELKAILKNSYHKMIL